MIENIRFDVAVSVLFILIASFVVVSLILRGLSIRREAPVPKPEVEPVVEVGYSWADYMADIEQDVPLDEILEKFQLYGKPEKPKGAKDEPEEFKAKVDARHQERSAWWDEMAKTQTLFKVVAPPKPVAPRPTVNVRTIPCSCISERRYGQRFPCKACGGRGFVYLEDGR